jgi:acetate---CoA ligase (ADP-forming)
MQDRLVAAARRARDAPARAELPRPVQRGATSTRSSRSFEQGWPIPGNIGIASQSGAYGTHLFAVARDRGIGTPVCVTTGNEADVHARRRHRLDGAGAGGRGDRAYAEGIRDGARFTAALDRAPRAASPW